MNKIFTMCLLLLSIQTMAGSDAENAGGRNMALHLDGKDNNVRTGMGIINAPWTIEAWIRGDGNEWNDLEVIVGGGEYSELNIADNLPLVVRKGKLCSTGAGLSSPAVLDDKWHYVAATCDGKTTRLFLDGKEVAKTNKVTAILPGAIGVNDVENTFGGLIDEVRIWAASVPSEVLRDWMHRPLERSHPDFRHLKGYYNFEDFKDETSVNWVGKGHQAYHLRNGRNDYKGKAPMAHAVVNDNPDFNVPVKKQELFNAVTIPSEWDADRGSRDAQVLKLRVVVTGEQNPMALTELQLDLTGTTALSDVEKVHVYYTGQKALSDTKVELFSNGETPASKMVYRFPKKKTQQLAAGLNYFLVTFDVADQAVPGNVLNAEVASFKLDKQRITPEVSTDCVRKQVTENSAANPRIVKLLQWNIWHGGVHLGDVGQERVIDLIRATHADIVTMQEAYGAQNKIADSLGFRLNTRSAGDNLALFSRYPITPISSSEPFKSNPAKITLPDGRNLFVNDCWLRYAYRPEYTCVYPNSGMDPNVWVAEDSTFPLVDVKNLLEKDVIPYLDYETMPVLICGDFNSCSHLDWTEAARPMHYGYGPVAFPASQYMLQQGFKDSFREINPDEVAYQGGTFAAIYGQLQASRIDFIYYKGDIQAVASKIIRSAPEIDYVWASDHAAVLTVFELPEK